MKRMRWMMTSLRSAEGLSYERIHRVAEKSEVSMSEAAFSDATTRVHEYIGQGDVFQVNLSVRQSQQLQTHPMHIYEQVRKINPSPYMSYMQTEEFHIVSCSPELLVKKAGDEISTRPISGTRSSGKKLRSN